MNRKKKLQYLLFLIFIILLLFYAINYKSYKFYSIDNLCSEWRNHPNKRVSISKVLVDREDIIGIDKNNVIKLLGEPSKEIKENFDSSIVYACRKNRPLLGYTLFLNIEFDQNNKVINLYTFIVDD